MSDTVKENYELAFHIVSTIDEADVQKTQQELEKMITSHGGVISFAKSPERIRLAYPIKHQQTAYFGHFNFILEVPESVNEIREELRHNNNVLRFLILKHKARPKAEKEDLVRKLAQAERRRQKSIKPAETPVQKETAPKVEEAELEKKLEEIIDKI